MLQSLPGVLVPGQMVFFFVVRCRSAVRVRGELVKLGSSLVRVVWHGVSGLRSTAKLRTILFVKLSNKRHSGGREQLFPEPLLGVGIKAQMGWE